MIADLNILFGDRNIFPLFLPKLYGGEKPPLLRWLSFLCIFLDHRWLVFYFI